MLIAEQMVLVIKDFGAQNFGAIVSDNGGGCEKARVLSKALYPHLAIQRYGCYQAFQQAVTCSVQAIVGSYCCHC